MNWLLTFIFGKKCIHCGVRGYLKPSYSIEGAYFCHWCFKYEEY